MPLPEPSGGIKMNALGPRFGDIYDKEKSESCEIIITINTFLEGY